MEKNNLNEEVKRIKQLMSFEIGDNSHDLLSEQNIQEQLKITKKRDGDFRVTKGKRRHIGKGSKSDEVDYEDEDWSDDSEHRKKHLVEKFKQKLWRS